MFVPFAPESIARLYPQKAGTVREAYNMRTEKRMKQSWEKLGSESIGSCRV